MRHPYADFIHLVAKPARYLGGEYQSIVKDHASVDATIALAFPDLYDIGMSHLGTKILYSVFNKNPRIAAERVFAPWPDLECELRARSLPLVSLESALPLTNFDVVGFSLQFELTFTTVLLMLELGGIPLRSADRDDEHPLILAGGPSATHPEAMADFLDAILIGDGEERGPEIVLRWKECRRAKMPRREALIEIAKLGGVYVPSLYGTMVDDLTGLMVVSEPLAPGVPAKVERALVMDINRFPFPDNSPEPVAEAIFDRMAVEIARGCTEGCRFCQAGMITRPVRERDPAQIVAAVLGAVDKGGYDEVSLTALSTADVSCIAPLIEKVSEELTRRRVSMSVSSLRAYGLPGEVLDDISRVRAAGLTFAPEAGTARMRDVIAKNITEEDMTETAHRVFSRGWQKPKLYFMIGLPTEQDEDVRGIIETGRKVRDIGHEHQPRSRVDVNVSVSTHVPKPHTPFQWCAMDTLDEIARKQKLLQGLAREAKVKLKMHAPDGSWLECVLGRGDRRLGNVIERAYRAGARFDGWDEHLRIHVWRDALSAEGIDPVRYLGTIPVSARLPWDHLDVGLEPGFLVKEYRKALAGRLSPPCGKPFQAKVHHTNLEDARKDERRLVCYDCGVACDLTRMKEERIEFLQILGAEKRREPAAPAVPVESDPAAAAAPRGRKARREPPKREGQLPEAARVRLQFTKLGRAAFTGHLDLVRVLPRILRRGGIETCYSQGFHPHPQMSFGPALGLGIASLAEYVDVSLTEDLTPAAIMKKLTAVTPEGLVFRGVRRLRPADRSLGEAAAVADYILALDSDSVDLPSLVGRIVNVERKGKAREIQVAECVLGTWWLAPEQVPAELELPETPSRLLVRIRLQGGLKPIEVAAALLGEGVVPRAIARVGLWSEDLSDPLGGPAEPLVGASSQVLAPAAEAAPASA